MKLYRVHGLVPNHRYGTLVAFSPVEEIYFRGLDEALVFVHRYVVGPWYICEGFARVAHGGLFSDSTGVLEY